jgi:hypothetical protein
MKRAIRCAVALPAAALPACSAPDEPDRERGGRSSPNAAEPRPGEKGTNPPADRLAELGLVRSPPANLIEACKRVARQTNLTVYCPPVVPEGPVEAPVKRHENAYAFGEEDTYVFSLQSESLVDRNAARKNNPDFPNFPNRPRGDDFAWNALSASHWVVAALRPARLLRRILREDLLFPGGQYEVEPRHFTVRGVRATVITGDIAAGGLASSAHAIVFWRIGGTGYMASVHFDNQAPVAEQIARRLIKQMVECPPRSPDRGSQTCKWTSPRS